ncbi:hypothetical protein AOQ84DRAFT_342611 [Glonium stellatum]|uniref:CorA-like transporter domain-containing protein n=1 Tax=Glonium stellatum TaxID=574774 RepID=A0A8E2EYM6_9PEZI|nr:hypothetical protein AOQ84DRAFT_342611 [Glonium stellatum]
MLMSTLSYHQVMPTFLDFLFPFGQQEYPQDFHFSGFRHQSRLREVDRGLRIPELGRSGKDFQLCYSLKSVESSKGQVEWPWSIRQMAIYHSFDFESGRTVWIVIKGNRLMRNRVKQTTGANKRSRLFDTPSHALSAALETHLVYSDWSAENWRWYINFLEEQLQTSTRHTLQTTHNFQFSDLQNTQHIEEKVNETLLILRMNTKILKELKEYYSSLLGSQHSSEYLNEDYEGDISRFENRVSSVISDLQMQESRLETLLRLLADRKALYLSEKSGVSAVKMENMTRQMHKIAVKTEQETVSMRIITLVTLFFLPGTFISTLMSTDIVRFPSNQMAFSSAATKTYVAITLPVMFLTFLSAYIYYRCVKRTDNLNWSESDDDAERGDLS